MAFNNVEVASLNNAINSCKNTINYKNTIEILNNIESNNIWFCSSKENLSFAMIKLVDNYKNLEASLEKLSNVATQIEKYKNLELKNEQIKQQIAYLETDLYYYEEYQEIIINSKGEEEVKILYRTVLNESVQNKIYTLQRQYSNNIKSMELIESTIASMI